jgi:hypothetical protein
MPMTRKIYRQGEQPVALTVEQLAEIESLKRLSDSDIDHRDDGPTPSKSDGPQINIETMKNGPFLR